MNGIQQSTVELATVEPTEQEAATWIGAVYEAVAEVRARHAIDVDQDAAWCEQDVDELERRADEASDAREYFEGEVRWLAEHCDDCAEADALAILRQAGI
jgi:hypothetical protein